MRHGLNDYNRQFCGLFVSIRWLLKRICACTRDATLSPPTVVVVGVAVRIVLVLQDGEQTYQHETNSHMEGLVLTKGALYAFQQHLKLSGGIRTSTTARTIITTM